MNHSMPLIGRRAGPPDATAPDGSEIRFLIDQRHQARGASLVEVTLPAGQVSRPVWHRTVEEVWYVLEGEGQVWRCSPDNDPSAIGPVAVAPGDALTIPTRWRFQFSASRDGPYGSFASPCRPGRELTRHSPPSTGDWDQARSESVYQKPPSVRGELVEPRGGGSPSFDRLRTNGTLNTGSEKNPGNRR